MLPGPPPLGVEPLYLEHHSWLRGWLRSRLGCPHHAADLAQDTFVRVLSKSAPIEAQEPRAYLTTIARGLTIDFFRRRSLERAYLEVMATQPEAVQPSLEERAMVLEALSAIDAMLDGLKPAVREAFLLSQFEGLTYKVIAERLGVTERTVANYLQRALERCYDLAP